VSPFIPNLSGDGPNFKDTGDNWPMKTGGRLTQNLVRYVVSFTAKIGIDVGMVCCYWLIFVYCGLYYH